MFTRALMAVASTASPLYMVALVNMDCRNIVRPALAEPGSLQRPCRVGSDLSPLPLRAPRTRPPKQQGEAPKDLSPFALPLSCDGSTQNWQLVGRPLGAIP
jgi:hypothetical protein